MQAVSAQEDDALELSQPFQALALSTGERTPYAESEYSAPLHNDSYSKSADQQPCVSDHDSDYGSLPPLETQGRVVAHADRWDWPDVEHPSLTRPVGTTVVPGVNEQPTEGIPSLIVQNAVPENILFGLE